MCAVHLDLWLDDERDPQDHGCAGWPPPMSIALHSQNPVGRQRMQAALASIHRLARPAR